MTEIDDAIRAALAVTAAPPSKAKPARLTEQTRRLLADRGDMDLTTAATAKVRDDRCRNCRAEILLGLDPWGIARRLDPEPLTALGEALAVLHGGQPFGVYQAAGIRHIEHRDGWSIKGHPPGGDTDVHVEHVCGEAADLPRQPSCLPSRRVEIQSDSECPF